MKKQENNQPPEEEQEDKLERVKQEQQEQEQEHQKHTISNPPSPTMHSSSPPPNLPSSPADSPTLHPLSPDQTSHNYVFSAPEGISGKAKATSPPAVTVEVNNVGSKAQDGEFVRQVEEGDVGNGGVTGERRLRPNLSILRKAKRENIKGKTLLGCRIFGFVFCLVSLSVMASDKNKGWALDSFHRYKEFRYCLAVNVLGFVYSGFQAYDLAYSLTSGKHVPRNVLRCYFDFSLDQILTYLLLSASSSAAFRVEDWESNWGKDKFPAMARASVALSFLAFVAFALSSLISGYNLFNPRYS